MTQGNPLSPTLFNMIMDAIIRHWVTVAAPPTDGLEGLSLLIREMETYFYSSDGLIASTQPERLQRVFSVFNASPAGFTAHTFDFC